MNFRFDTSHRVNNALNPGLQNDRLEWFGDDIGCAKVKGLLFSVGVGRRCNINNRHVFERHYGFQRRANFKTVVMRVVGVEKNERWRVVMRESQCVFAVGRKM